MKTHRVVLIIPHELWNESKKAAIDLGISTSELTRQLLKNFCLSHNINVMPRPTAPVRDPNIEWMELEIPRCIKTREQWNCWIGVKKDENLKWKVNGENQQWIIPDEPPKGLLEDE